MNLISSGGIRLNPARGQTERRWLRSPVDRPSHPNFASIAMNLEVDLSCKCVLKLPKGACLNLWGEFMFVSKAVFSAVFLSLTASTAFAGANGPVKSVTLSSGGLAEIVRSATVGQNAEINIDVPLDQVDDILKSIVVRDEKGHVKSLSLAGPTPVDETFKTLPFKPSDLTSLPALLNSIKGSRIQAGEQQGIVLGVTEIPGNAQMPLSWLSFLRDDGAIAMVPIPGTQITIVDPAIKDKLKGAMSVISKARAIMPGLSPSSWTGRIAAMWICRMLYLRRCGKRPTGWSPARMVKSGCKRGPFSRMPQAKTGMASGSLCHPASRSR